MKQLGELCLNQQVVITPQLQQAIKLLQMSNLELQQKVQVIINTNPFIDYLDELNEDFESKEDNKNITDTYINTDIPDKKRSNEDSNYELYNIAYEKSLRNALIEQVNLSNFSATEKEIALFIIDNINENGYLTINPEDLKESIPFKCDISIINQILSKFHSFEPTGVGAKNLKECLCIQLDANYSAHPYYAITKKLVEMNYFSNKINHYKLLNKLKISKQQLHQINDLIKRLHPKPGLKFKNNFTQYIIPDIYVYKRNNTWKVSLNKNIMPNIGFNKIYYDLSNKYNNDQQGAEFIKKNMQEAKWFIKSIANRNETILKVSKCIVNNQIAFLEKGEIWMQPMILGQIAYEIGMHESTISRATANKYMSTPRGIFELKYFFSNSIKSKDGELCSSLAIQAKIKQFIAQENTHKPLSDKNLAGLLADEGINIARRTITKYREKLGIPSSTERRFNKSLNDIYLKEKADE